MNGELGHISRALHRLSWTVMAASCPGLLCSLGADWIVVVTLEKV